jgi:hypothetical protein
MRIWAATVVLTSFWLMSGVIATSALADNAKTSSGLISQSNNAKPITVNKAEFGLVRVDSKGKFSFTPTIRVPLQEGVKYGWRIQLQNYKGEVKWREVLRLPKPPETWATDDGENLTLSADGSEAVTNRIESTTDGVIENFWTIAPGDPIGKHRIQVYINDRLIAAFDFEIVPSGKKQSPLPSGTGRI